MGEPLVIDTAALRKRYDGVDALRGLDLAVPAGSICGLLGRNGAGKTTTAKILLGMTRPTAGQARVFGRDATADDSSVEIRRRTAFVSEEKALYPYMTVDEIIRFTAAFYPGWRRDLEERYVRSFGVARHRKIKTLSLGMRAKVALLLALCRGADLLILDEPTLGLDPSVTEEVLQALVGHVAGGEQTVLFSSHQIAHVEQIADRVAIVHAGRTVVAGALDDLRERFRRVQLVFEREAPEAAFRAAGVTRVQRHGRVLTVYSRAGAEAVLEEARALAPVAVDVTALTLKDIFLEASAEEE